MSISERQDGYPPKEAGKITARLHVFRRTNGNLQQAAKTMDAYDNHISEVRDDIDKPGGAARALALLLILSIPVDAGTIWLGTQGIQLINHLLSH